MTTRFMKAVLVLACTAQPLFQLMAHGLSSNAPLENWLRENRLLVSVQLRCLDLPIAVDNGPKVLHYIERYLRPGRRETERMLGRAAYYLPIFERELRRRGLPETLKFLPIVESGLLPGITSPAGAVGLWQFMPATARYFELVMNDRLDERRDPRRSTAAAARLLSHLYDEFCDWSLALAAYNCGPGRVRRLLRRTGSRHYRAIRPYLPGQTQRYIDKFQAVAYVATYYEAFGLSARPDANLPTDVVTWQTNERLSFRAVAERGGLSQRTIRRLNPAYLLPVAEPGQTVVLPAFAAEQLLASFRTDDRPVAAIENPGLSPNRPEKRPVFQMGVMSTLLFTIDRLKTKLRKVHGIKRDGSAAVTLPQPETPGRQRCPGDPTPTALRQRPAFRFEKLAC